MIQMAYAPLAVFCLLTSLTITSAQSVDENASQVPSWMWPYLQVYPPVFSNETAGGPRSIYFALMMSFGGNFKSSGTIPGVQAALDRINSDPTMLPGYKLHYTLTDSQCNRTVALDAFIKQIVQYPVKIGWIGSGCSLATEPTAEISQHYNITQISCISSSSELTNRQRFRYYFQLLATASDTALGFFSIIRHFMWRRVAIIEQNENLFTVTMERLKGLLTQAGVNFTDSIFNTEDSIEGLGSQPFDPQARIFVIASFSPHARRLLCKAYQSGMRYPQYMFLTIGWYAVGWWRGEEGEDGCTSEQRGSVLSNTLSTLLFEFRNDRNTTTDSGINGFEYDIVYEAHRDSSPLDVGQNRTDIYAQHCYDATWTLAFALNKTITEFERNSTLNADIWEAAGLSGNATFSLRDFSYNNSALLDVIFKHARDTSFSGITGNVSFDANGIRAGRRSLVNQYRYKDGTIQRMQIADVLGETEDYQLVYLPGEEENSWPGRLIPYDGVPLEQDVAVAIPLTVTFSILSAAGIAFTISCLAFNFIFRKKKLIRLSSPNLNYVIGAGAIILYIDVCFFIVPTTDPHAVSILYNITPWLTALGYSLCYGTILAKMVRVYLIFDRPTLKKRSLKDWYLAVGVFLLVFIDLIILLTYNIVEGVQGNLTAVRVPNRENVMDVNGERSVTTLYFTYICDSTARDIYLGILYGYKMVLQIIALVLAFATRKVKVKGLDDAKYIAAAIYVTSIVLAVIIVSTYTLKGFVNGFAAVFCTGFLIGTTFILVLVFVPKMVSLYRDPQGQTIFPTSAQTNHVRSQIFYQSEGSSDAEIVRTLRRRLAELEATQSQNNQDRSPCNCHVQTQTDSSLPTEEQKMNRTSHVHFSPVEPTP